MHAIFCYGDSNTWGLDPATRNRHPRAATWPYVMARALGPAYDVAVDGLRGRTALLDDPLKPGRNGLASLPERLAAHAPLDLVIIMLGTNNCKHVYGLDAHDIGLGIEAMGQLVLASDAGRDGTPPRLLLVAPPPLEHEAGAGGRYRGGLQKSRELAEQVRAIAATLGCACCDAPSVARASDVDGIHLGLDAHAALGNAMADAVRRTLVSRP
ncbi:MAG: SGNH/GDSL hydrolase family protein [Desulfovibrionaceae bacterium]